MNQGYEFKIYGSNYEISVSDFGESKEHALEMALYKLINSTPKIDLFGQTLDYDAELIEEWED